jgi:hypothetical protein
MTYVALGAHTWQRAESEAEALAGLIRNGGRAPFLIVRIDDAWIDPRVDQLGRVWADRGPVLAALYKADPLTLATVEPYVIAEAWSLARRGGKRQHLDPVTLQPYAPRSILAVEAEQVSA